MADPSRIEKMWAVVVVEPDGERLLMLDLLGAPIPAVAIDERRFGDLKAIVGDAQLAGIRSRIRLLCFSAREDVGVEP